MDGDNHPAKKALIDARERAIARLTEAFARDQISIDAFEQRINDAYQRASIEELDALTADLDATEIVNAEIVPAPSAAPLAIATAKQSIFARAILGTSERTGTFALPANAYASAVLGSLVLDFRDAQLEPGVTTEVHVRAVLGSIEIIVPADIAVECSGSGILGSFEGTSRAIEALDPNAPRLRIVGSAVLGSIEIQSKPPSRVQIRVEQIRARKLLPR